MIGLNLSNCKHAFNRIEHTDISPIKQLNQFPSLLIKIFDNLSEKEKQIVAVTCRFWHSLSSQPFGLIKPELGTSWAAKIQSWFPGDFSALSLQSIKKGMGVFRHKEGCIQAEAEGEADSSNTKNQTHLAIQPTARFLQQTPRCQQHTYMLKVLQTQFNKDPYLKKVVDAVIAQEVELSQTHYPTYHALNLDVYVFTLLTKQLLYIFNIGKEEIKDPVFSQMKHASWLRFPNSQTSNDPKNISQFLTRFPMEDRGVDGKGGDHNPEVQKLLICLNPFLFGNFMVDGEETWLMFLKNQSVGPPNFEKLFGMLCDHFKLLPILDVSSLVAKKNIALRKGYSQALKNLKDELVFNAHVYLHKMQKNELTLQGRDREEFEQISYRDWGVIGQFLIPRQIVDECAYHCLPYGLRDHRFGSAPVSEVLDRVNKDPEALKTVQLRALASSLINFTNDIQFNAFGFGDFFQTPTAKSLFDQVQRIFLDIIFSTAEKNE